MHNAKNKAFKRSVLLSVFLFLLVGVLTAAASSENGRKLLGFRPVVKLALTANVERDKKILPVNQQTILKSGEILQWELVSENEGNASAEGYKAVAKIPTGTVFVANSAKGEADAKTLYSIDGGKTFSEKPLIEEKQTDGTVKQVSAPVSMFTDVQFKWEKSLEAGQKLSAGYKVEVK